MFPGCSCLVKCSLNYYKFDNQFYSVITVMYSAVILTVSVLIGTDSDPESDNSDSSDSDFEPEKEVILYIT